MTPNRKLQWLWDRRIITTRLPITDKPTETFNWGWFYEKGTYQYYSLFHSPHLIKSPNGFSWHLRVLHFLNNFSYDELTEVGNFIANKRNGFTASYIIENIKDKIINDVYNDKSDRVPENRLRKVIFKMGCGLELHEKQIITGQLIGRSSRINNDDVIACAYLISQRSKKVTVSGISRSLGCSRTILYKLMDTDTKNQIHRLNKDLNDEKLQRKKLPKTQKGHSEKSARLQVMGRIYEGGIDY